MLPLLLLPPCLLLLPLQQVDASQVSIGSSWAPVLRKAVSKVSQSLGISIDDKDDDSGSGGGATECLIEARLYKLLLYEQVRV